MIGKNPSLKDIKESVIDNFKRNFPNERLHGKVFSIYVLDLYAKLIYKIYKKAAKLEDK